MYRIVIVDDEYYVCSLIKGLLNEVNLEIQIEKCFYNGDECLDYILEKNPDIVITDVQIGDMTGLDIIRKVREQNMSTNFIIVSGYNYFDYAKQAIQYDVDNYLLKPIQKEELEEAVRKVVGKLDNRSGIKNHVEKIESQKRERDEQLFLQELWHENPKIETLSEEAIYEKYGLAFPNPYFCFGVVHIDQRESDEKDTILSAHLLVLFRKSFEEYPGGVFVCTVNSINLIFLINTSYDNMDHMGSYLKNYVRRIAERYSDDDIRISIGISDSKEGTHGIIRSVITAKACVKSRHLLRRKKIITGDTIRKNTDQDYTKEFTNIRETLGKILDMCDFEKISQYCTDVFSEKYHMQDPALFFKSLETVQDFLIKAETEIKTKQEIKTVEKVDLLEESFFDINCLFTAYKNFVQNIIDSLAESVNSSQTKMISGIKEFIKMHYAEHIELEGLAEHVYVTPAYLSSLFKEETGEGIKEYHTRIRMENAKSLLDGAKYNVSEIADMVGYSDAKYFAKAFKKYTGVKPSEYRKIRHKLNI